MFKKVLIADDHASVNNGVVKMLLENASIPQIEFAQYCDDVYLKVQKAILENKPYDLLITDLDFTSDYRMQKIQNGLELIKAIKDKQPAIKTIIYSVENRETKIKAIKEKYKINAFVSKGRNGLKELLKAVTAVSRGEDYFSKEINLDRSDNTEIDDFDILLLEKLAEGIPQDKITEEFKRNHIKPNSLSTIEKRINRLKILLKAKNGIHLIARAKDLGLI